MFRTTVQKHTPVDVAVIGGGLAGMATALRLQAAGLSTRVYEAHGHAGGCAGYWRHRHFSFDVGATTLVDFAPGGVGAQLLDCVGLPPVEGEALPGYLAWLPDRQVRLHRDPVAWHAERLRAFGDSSAHRDFWRLLDRVADGFWQASRAGLTMPLRGVRDVVANLRSVGAGNLALTRHLGTSLGAALRRHRLDHDRPLCYLLGMLVEDTVHSSVQRAPLINAALGITIRGAGLTRPYGGMHGFWRTLVARYRSLGGQLWTGARVSHVDGYGTGFAVTSRLGRHRAQQVVFAVPAEVTAAISPASAGRLRRYLVRDRAELGGAVVVFLGVPDREVAGQDLTHHQLLQSYDRPLGDGNNMFVSVSAPGDTLSAPAGHRAVMISTHTALAEWTGLDEQEYALRKKEIREQLIGYARRVYPDLGERAVVCDVGTPRAFERFAFRPYGAVGGPHQTLRNTNQFAIPHDLLGRGAWMVGDSTWPGLGTVACVIGSRIVADGIRRERRRGRVAR